MVTFDQSLLKLVQDGKITVDDAFKAVLEPARLRAGDAAGRDGPAGLAGRTAVAGGSARLGERAIPAARPDSSIGTTTLDEGDTPNAFSASRYCRLHRLVADDAGRSR